jgi:hypothetical protein
VKRRGEKEEKSRSSARNRDQFVQTVVIALMS